MKQNFENAKIYQISNDFNDDVYIGSTCDELIKRMSYHKNDRKHPKKENSKFYSLMNSIGFERFRIDLVESYPCNDRQALHQREGFWIRQKGTLNSNIAGRTLEEYKTENQEELKRKEKVYYEMHYKIYYQKNKDKILQNKKDYQQINKEKYAEKVLCECGCLINKRHLKEHQQTIKHLSKV